MEILVLSSIWLTLKPIPTYYGKDYADDDVKISHNWSEPIAFDRAQIRTPWLHLKKGM